MVTAAAMVTVRRRLCRRLRRYGCGCGLRCVWLRRLSRLRRRLWYRYGSYGGVSYPVVRVGGGWSQTYPRRRLGLWRLQSSLHPVRLDLVSRHSC